MSMMQYGVVTIDYDLIAHGIVEDALRGQDSFNTLKEAYDDGIRRFGGGKKFVVLPFMHHDEVVDFEKDGDAE